MVVVLSVFNVILLLCSPLVYPPHSDVLCLLQVRDKVQEEIIYLTLVLIFTQRDLFTFTSRNTAVNHLL